MHTHITTPTIWLTTLLYYYWDVGASWLLIVCVGIVGLSAWNLSGSRPANLILQVISGLWILISLLAVMFSGKAFGVSTESLVRLKIIMAINLITTTYELYALRKAKT